jgi:serine/threonine protein phosphatase 1
VKYFRSCWLESPRPTPPDTLLFAVGDVHGCLDHLRALHAVIAAESCTSGHPRKQVIYLGDYVDRGPDAPGVLAALRGGLPHEGIEPIFLMGNHDRYLLEGLRVRDHDRQLMELWIEWGGLSTLAQFGLAWRQADRDDLPDFSRRLRARVGDPDQRFVEGLALTYRIGEFLFVHAGIRPGVPLEQQTRRDLLFLREPFLSWPAPEEIPYCVVHGHSIEAPTVLPHRIGVDTGAYMTDSLTAVQIADGRLCFHTVSTRDDLDAFAYLGGTLGPDDYGPPAPIPSP